VVFVRDGADPVTADGTESRPFATLVAGVRAAGTGGWVLVGTGTYRENLAITVPMHIVGACADRVVIDGDALGGTIEIDGAATRVEIRGVEIRGTASGILATRGAHVSVSETRITSTVAAGVSASDVGTEVLIDDSFVHDIRPNMFGQARGIATVRGAHVGVTRVAILGTREAAILADGAGCRANVSDSLVRGTLPRSTDGILGGALVAGRGATIVAQRVLLDANSEVAVQVDRGDSTIEISDALVRGTRPRRTGELGRALSVLGPGTIRARRVALLGNRDVAAGAEVSNATLEISESLIADTSADAAGAGGYGLYARDSGRITATSVSVVRNSSCGVYVEGTGTSVTLSDTVVAETRPGTVIEGFGVFALGGASAVLERVRLESNTYAGAAVADDRATLSIRRSVVAGTRLDPMRRRGGGLLCLRGARLTAVGIRAIGNVGAAVGVNDRGSILSLSDSIIGRTTTQPSEAYGIGVGVANSGSATVLRTDIVETEEVGAFASGEGSTLVMRETTVRDVRRREWDDGAFHFVSGGIGIGVGESARVDVFDSTVSDTPVVALAAYGAGGHLHADNVHIVPPSIPERAGGGVLAQARGSVECTRVLVQASTQAAVVALGPGTSLTIADSAIRDTRMTNRGVQGTGLGAARGASLVAERVLIERSRERAVFANEPDTRVRLTDLFVRDVSSTARGQGFGVVASGGAEIHVERVSVIGAGGAAIGAIPVDDPVFGTIGGSRITGTYIFVSDTRTSTVRLESGATMATPTGMAVAYGLHVGFESTLQVRQALVSGGGYGFFNSHGTLDIESLFVRSQLDAAGAADSSRQGATMRLTDTHYESNTIDGVVRSDTLPTASSLSPPTPVCTRSPCE